MWRETATIGAELERMWLGLSLIDWIIVVELFGIGALSIVMSRTIHDQTNFFMDGRRIGKIFMIFFSFASGADAVHRLRKRKIHQRID